MIKKVFGVVFFVILVFALGIFLENKIRTIIKTNKINVSEEKILVENIRETAKVMRVIDGDTIELSDGRRVRYIGVNSPEMTDKRKNILCFANMAKVENQKLVEGRTVELEKDISDKDKYDRLLRYVWINNKMVNLTMVEGGYAKVATYPPDVKYKDLFLSAEKSAKQTVNKLICNKI